MVSLWVGGEPILGNGAVAEFCIRQTYDACAEVRIERPHRPIRGTIDSVLPDRPLSTANGFAWGRSKR
jgi:hypothetical protein